LANNTSSARIAPTAAAPVAAAPVAQAASSSIHLTLHRLEIVVEQVETRLKRLEHGHSSLRRRVVKAVAS
jgi:hypothetical protein